MAYPGAAGFIFTSADWGALETNLLAAYFPQGMPKDPQHNQGQYYYYENDGSGTFYILNTMDNGNTFDSCGNGFAIEPDWDNIADLELEITERIFS